MKNILKLTILVSAICIFCGSFVPPVQGQVTIGQSYIWVTAERGADRVNVEQVGRNKDLLITFYSDQYNPPLIYQQTIPNNPDHKYLIVEGTYGDDDIYVQSDKTMVVLGITGRNRITAAGLGNAFVYGGNGDDVIQLKNDGLSYGFGNEGNDEIWGRSDENFLYGGSGNDLLVGAGYGDDTVDGGDGHDMIATGKGVDIVKGGAGSDLVWVFTAGYSVFDLGPAEATAMLRANPPNFFPVDAWYNYYWTIYGTQYISEQFDWITDVLILPPGGHWEQG